MEPSELESLTAAAVPAHADILSLATLEGEIATGSMASPLGRLELACRPDGRAVALGWDGPDELVATLRSMAAGPIASDEVAVAPLRLALERYFASGTMPPLAVAVVATSTFRRRVLAALAALAPGQITTYGALATSIGAGVTASRAIGGAVGHNPLPIVVPCHRVLAAGGGIGGFSGGLDRKRWLLAHEGIARPATPPRGR